MKRPLYSEQPLRKSLHDGDPIELQVRLNEVLPTSNLIGHPI